MLVSSNEPPCRHARRQVRLRLKVMHTLQHTCSTVHIRLTRREQQAWASARQQVRQICALPFLHPQEHKQRPGISLPRTTPPTLRVQVARGTFEATWVRRQLPDFLEQHSRTRTISVFLL